MGAPEKLTFPVGGYDTPEELWEKLDWEGGFVVFFLDYHDLQDWAHTPLADPLQRLDDALSDIRHILNESGVEVE